MSGRAREPRAFTIAVMGSERMKVDSTWGSRCTQRDHRGNFQAALAVLMVCCMMLTFTEYLAAAGAEHAAGPGSLQHDSLADVAVGIKAFAAQTRTKQRQANG